MFFTMPHSTNHLQVIKLIYAFLETKSSTGVEWMGPGIYTYEIKLSPDYFPKELLESIVSALTIVLLVSSFFNKHLLNILDIIPS